MLRSFRGLGNRYSLHQDPGRDLVSGGRDRLVLATYCRMGDAEPTTNRPHIAGVAHGCLAAQANAQSLSAF